MESLQGRPVKVVYLVTRRYLGEGPVELGAALMSSFLYTVTEGADPPQALLFVNEGVFLTTTGSEVLDSLAELERQGSEIVSCGTCLDYYGKKDQVCVGRIGNMFEISEAVHNYRSITL